MCICVISQRNHDFTEQKIRGYKIQIWFSFKFLLVQRKNLRAPSYVYLHTSDCFFPNLTFNFFVGAKKKLYRLWLRIVRDVSGLIMKRFTAIEFKQKWIVMPFCSPTHLVSDWYWTLITQIDLRFSNRLVNINHLNLSRQNFSSIFCSRQEIKCQV